MADSANRGWIDGLGGYFEKPILATFAFGMASGFPLTFVFSIVGIWLSDKGVSASDVGLFALAGSFYAWKVLWAPLMDWLPVRPLTGPLGQRRGWLLLIQGAMTLALVAVSTLDPAQDLVLIAALVAAVGFLSASQDIVIDAYRIEMVDESRLGYSASSYTLGYRFANWVAGVGVLFTAATIGWQASLALLPALFIPALAASFWVGEPAVQRHSDSASQNFFIKAVVMPFRAFTKREGWWLILVFILFYKAGDAVTQIMMNPMIVQKGYSLIDIAYASKTVGAIALIVGAGLGGAVYRMLGMYRALLITGLFMMITNLGFAWLSLTAVDPVSLALVVGLENFASGIGGVVAIAYFSSLCDIEYTATQYALISSLASQARALLSAPSGFLADWVGWFDFFVIATLAAVPGLLLLTLMWKRDKREALA